MSSATPSRSPHWPALDGWRGFTIWFAISVHAGYFTGGGVLSLDTFFALSGFLITGLLLREWQRREGIDLLAFWARRARRLLPALFVVLAAVVAYAAFVASPLGLDTLRGDMLSTLGYGANWRFVLSGQSYFSSFTTPSPVLHMWSLAVEEQFYLVWPLIVLGVLWWARRRLSTTGAIVAVGVVAAVGAIASAIEMAVLYTPGGDVSRVYYGTDTRAQAMLVGAVLAVVVLLHGPVRTRVAQRALSIGAGFALVVVVVPWFAGDAREIHDVFYGRFGLLAYSVATAVVLWRLTQPSVGWFGRVLEASPLRWVGAISYEMYLWHWPTYLFLTEQRTSLDGGWLLVFRLAVVVALSWATNVLVSGPIRRGVGLRSPRRARSAAAMLAVVVTVGTFAATVGAEPVLTGDTGQVAVAGPPPTAPGRGPTPADPGDEFLKVLVVGDSQGATLAQGPGVEGGQHGLTVQPHVLVWNRALLGCAISTRPTFVVEGHGVHNKCGADGVWQRLWSTDVTQFDPDVVVVAAGAWDLYDVVLDDGRVVAPGDDPTWSAGYEHDVVQMFEALGATGAPVIAVVPPCYGEDTYPGAEPPPAERQDPGRIRGVKRAWTAAARVAGTTMAPLDDVLCPDGTSDPSLRPDGVHYDGAGADRIAPAVMATARVAFARSTGVGQSSLRTPRKPNQASSATHPAS